MVTTVAEMIGTPANADAQDLNRTITVGDKATGVGTKVPVGRVAAFNGTTWALATAGSTGRKGVVPKLDPINDDSSPTLQVVTQKNAEIYVEGNGAACKPGNHVASDTGGKVKDDGPVPTANSFATYEGHNGEGRGHGTKATNGTAGEAWRIKLI
jgi:hypothetical protein